MGICHRTNLTDVAMFRGNIFEGKFVSKNIINLSRRNLSSMEISLLSKGLKFVPNANKKELAEYGRKLRLMWHFRYDEKQLLILETKMRGY